jgi:phage baseplate assembly protein W
MAFKLGGLNEEVEGLPELYQRVKLLLLTDRGSVPGDPLYGTAIADCVPYTDEQRPKIISEIMRAIGLYCPDIRVSEIDIREKSITITVQDVGAIVI